MSLVVGLMSVVAASAWTQASTDSIESEGVRFGTGASIGAITEKMRITQGGLVGIGTATPTALLTVAGDISSAGVVQVSGSSLTCSSAIKGAMRYSNISSTLEYCNSTAWTSLGPSDTAVTTGASYRSAVQAIGSGSWTAISFDTETFDTAGMVNIAGQPTRITIPSGRTGFYLINAWVQYPANATGGRWIQVNKNGIDDFYCNMPASASLGGAQGLMCSNVVYLSAGDYLELFTYQGSGSSLNAKASFRVAQLAPQAGSSGGGATPAGSTGDIQFNNAGALAADTGNFTYTSGLLTAPIISGTAHNGQYASFTTASIASLGVGTINASGLITTTVGLNTAGTVSASTISATNISGSIIQVGNTGATCSSAIKGAMRYSNISSTMEYCNSTAWTSLGPSDTAVGFVATGNQTIGTATAALTGWTEQRDDGGGFNAATGQYTAPSAGYYVFSVNVSFNDANTNYPRVFITNGVRNICDTFELSNDGNNFRNCAGVTYLSAGQTITAYAGAPGGSTGSTTYFSGFKAGSPASVEGGGGTTPAGGTGDIQFNNAGALAADTGQLYWDATNNRLGVGTTTPTVALHIVGDIAYTGVMSDVSDRRMKRDITTLGDAVAERLMLLKPVTFRMKDAEDTEYGFIAQDVQQVFPELVRDGEILSLNYVGLIAPAVKTIQLLKRENDEQGDQINALAEQNRLLRMQVKELMLETRKTQREVERLTGAVH